MKISIANDSIIKDMSHGEIKNVGTYDFHYKTPKPYEDGLFCQKIFGPTISYTCGCGYKKVIKTHEVVCKECGIPHIDKNNRNNRFGHINTNSKYINPLSYKLISKIFNIPEKVLKEVSLGKLSVKLTKTDDNAPIETVSGDFYKLEVSEDKTYEGNINSIFLLVKGLKLIDVDPIKILEDRSGLLGLATYLKKGYDLFSFFNSCVLVKPAGMRDLKYINDDTVSFENENKIYNRLVREGIKINALTTDVKEYSEIIDDMDVILSYESNIIQKLMNSLIIDGINYGYSQVTPAIDKFGGKTGLIRNTSLGKRQDFSGRSVVVADPLLPLDTVRLPVKMMYKLLKPHILGKLIEFKKSTKTTKGINLMKWVNKQYNTESAISLDILNKLVPTVKVLVNRAPTLHRYNVMSFNVVLHQNDNKAIGFPGLSCSPFNMDFDGDTVSINLVIGNKSKHEANTIIDIKSHLMDSINHNVPNISLSHESLIGAWMLTKEGE